ncbi:MAG TPA: LysE family translocator [Acidimicrobiia bacterium]
MPSASAYLLFILTAVTLLLIPGPAVMYVVGQSIGRGRRAGLASVLGVHTGTLLHVTAAAVGISSLLVASATAFSIVKYAGAAYLIVLGARRLLGMEEPRETETRGPTDLRRHYRQGIVVNVLNPKTALFFLAFLPQFINPDGTVALHVFVLGLTFVVLGLVTDSTWALVAGATAERVRRSERFPRIERWVSGSVFVGLGVVAAAAGSRSSG